MNYGAINELIEEVKQGRKFILFPEGGYTEGKGNVLEEFKAGCFKVPLKTNTPIVPVAIIDSYKVFNSKITGTVKTQVHFLTPIMPEEYKGMKTKELAELVKSRIQKKIDEVVEMAEG
jgi:1-acyl-sn-glycerol-3-phosphate acyltransferase